MAIPTYDKFIEPILRYLAEHPEGSVASTVHEASSAALGISDEDKRVLLPSRTQPVLRTVLDGLMTDSNGRGFRVLHGVGTGSSQTKASIMRIPIPLHSVKIKSKH
jgi:restriction endonuclease Mrr